MNTIWGRRDMNNPLASFLLKMQYFFAAIFVIAILLMSFNAIAAQNDDKDDNSFPGGCYPKGYSFKYMMLHLHPAQAGGRQSVYFIHNKNINNSVKLYNMVNGNKPFITQLNNRIGPNRWGVIAANEKDLQFSCTIASRNYEYGKITSCKDVLEVCEYTNAKFAVNNHGNYWAVPSNTKYGARRQVIYQGVLLRW